jgi:hypothetical protein
MQSALGVRGCDREIYFYGHVLIAVRQVQQRRDADAAGEEQFSRWAAGRLYPSRRFNFGEFESMADRFATALTNVKKL